MPLVPFHRVEISHFSDLGPARHLAKAISHQLGFDERESEELTIVVNELASNLVKHASGGQLIFTPLEENGHRGLQIESVDNGPGIADVAQAMADGFSTTGSLGYGLGTVNRLTDEFEIRALSGGSGNLIRCLRWKREEIRHTGTCPLSFGIATRAYRYNREANGDAYVIKVWNKSALLALIDGLGHGQLANRAAQTAKEYIENHYQQPLEAIIRGVGRSCCSTRGVVLAVARFDWPTGPIKLTFTSIGNIEAKVFGNPAPLNFTVQRGVVGYNAPNPAITEHNWDPDYIMVLHTDGLSAYWRWRDYPQLARWQATRAAGYLLQKLADDNDDATVIVVRKSLLGNPQ